VQERFLQHVRNIITYWSTTDLNDADGDSIQRRIRGAAFSILVMLDGEAMDIPGFRVLPSPHEDDKAFHMARGERWYPDDVNIAGVLHELL